MIDSDPGVRTKVAALEEVTKVGAGVEDDGDVVLGVVDGVVDEDDGTEVLDVLEDDGTEVLDVLDVLEDDGTEVLDVLEDDGTDVLVVLEDDGTEVLDVLEDDGTEGATGAPLSGSEPAPAPTMFTAFNFTEYEVPFVKPVITIGDVVDAGLKAVNEVPPFVETS